MGFNLEGSKNNEINEVTEVEVDSEKLSETEETAENFDDCSLNEVQDSKGNEVNSESLENAEENYDDCEAKMEKIEEEKPELADDDDDFNDCGKETEGQYVAEVTYTTDGEVSEEKASAELQEAYNECDDPEDMQQLKENANENENIEVHNAEVVERPENAEMDSEITEKEIEEYEQVQEEMDEAQENLEVQQEAAQEYQEDLENQINNQENEVPNEGTENIDNQETEESTEVEEEPEIEEVEECPEIDEVEESAEEVEDESETEKVKGNSETEEVQQNSDAEDVESANIESEDLKQMDDDSNVEVSNIDEESVSENISQEVEDETGAELSEDFQTEIRDEVTDEINDEAEEGNISAAEAEEIAENKVKAKTESVESEIETIDDEIENRAEEVTENDNLTTEEAKEEVSDKVTDFATDSLSEEDTEAIVDEKVDVIEDTIEEKKEEKENIEAVEKVADELETEQAEQSSEQTQLSLQERIDGVFEKDEVSASEINGLREENAAELKTKIEEKELTESELKSKFDEVLSKAKGSDEYKQSLNEYNAIKDKKTILDEQITSMEEQQDFLDKKSLELRDAQIQKGNEAVAASAITLAGITSLQERYEQNYYDVSPNKAELANIREDGCAAIKELTDQKDSIKQAMDAKMDELSEYVVSNNMDRYDTAHDFRYQQLSADYIKLKENYNKISYSIVKLDENNRCITEQLGDKYISMADLPPVSRIPEVNNGTDFPRETNYFVDETKTAEILSPFRQDKWEQLSVSEQKQAIEKLADYNAEILGVEDKPRVVYYNAEDPCDFGGYSAKQNAIYINEYNMDDAAETADTISHEYRHKYQHERADKLETERDLEFKEGFDNYIRAEDDYQGYKEQLVESDARDYAQAVKEKIASYSETPTEIKTSFTEQGGQGTEFSALNPEKGAVFEKISADELPEDFEQKDRVGYKEVLEAQELDELRAIASVHYENGKAVWGKLGIQELESYKEHNDIENGHIEKVRLKSLEAADTLETHFSQNNYDGLYSPNIDRQTVEVMSIYHDTGMDGNIKAGDYKAEREAYISNEQIREKYVSDTVAKKEREAAKNGEPFDRAAAEAKANEKFEKEGFENHFRPNHSLESAIHALRDRESISNLNVSADEVALGCLVHSKSNSGLRNIASEDDWRTAVGRLQDRVDEYNKSHPDEQIHFDSSFLMNEDGSFKQDKLAEIRSEAIVLRIGDANGHDTNSRTSQAGKSIDFTLEQKAIFDELPNDFESKFEKGEYDEFFLEVQAAEVKIDGIELNNTNDPNGMSRMFAVGEGNFQSLNCEVDENGAIKQNFELCDGNAFPLSTQHCIEERLGEYKTAHPMKYTPVIKLGSNCSNETYKSYLAFADKIERDYNVRMEVKR